MHALTTGSSTESFLGWPSNQKSLRCLRVADVRGPALEDMARKLERKETGEDREREVSSLRPLCAVAISWREVYMARPRSQRIVDESSWEKARFGRLRALYRIVHIEFELLSLPRPSFCMILYQNQGRALGTRLSTSCKRARLKLSFLPTSRPLDLDEQASDSRIGQRKRFARLTSTAKPRLTGGKWLDFPLSG